MSSKADDFDVRYRDSRDGRAWGSGADGGYSDDDQGVLGGTVDYDLGYDAHGWDTQGFRSPTAGYLDQHETAQPGAVGTAAPPEQSQENASANGNGNGHGRGGNHARTGVTPPPGAPTWAGEPGSTGWFAADAGQTVRLNRVGRRARAGGPGGPPGPPGPGGPGGPGGPRGPRGRKVKVKVKGSWWRHWTWRKALGLVLAVIGAFIILGAVVIVMAYESTPVPTDAMAATGYAQSVVYAGNGSLIGRFGSTDRQELPYNQIPQDIINAVLAAEDRHFWSEGGISPTATIRAAFADLTGNNNSLQGGSTITQQFVRNYYTGIGTQQTLSRKIKEIFVAMKVAKQKSKQWILTNYLNTIYLGQGAYGIQAAAETYFGKPVSQLTVPQDALIAALIQQPSTYPLPKYRADFIARWHYVITGMVQMGNLPAAQAAALKFPSFGDEVPQSVGEAVWDPYVLNMVRTELKTVYGLTDAQIDNGGYIIKTSINDSKMGALYDAIVSNEKTIDADSSQYPFQPYMHAGAMLEDPATGQIQALYPGPGFPGSKANGTGKVLTAKQCGLKAMDCQWNMATQNREQVGSSFKPYILATAVKQGMNVQSSTLYGFSPAYIPPDSQPNAYPTQGKPDSSVPDYWQYYQVKNDPGQNASYTPQIAMAASVNTAFTDLWHVVGGSPVAAMAQQFGVNTDAACITKSCGTKENPVPAMAHEAGVTLGQASLTVAEQASMLATIADNGVYHDQHLITSLRQANNVPIPVKVTSRMVFSNDPMQNAEMDSQVQYAMSADTNPSYGTAPVAAMSNGQQIIAKTGTTETAESAFFEGAIPSQALVVALFTSEQDGNPKGQTLNLLGGQQQGGFGGTWPATIWHTYAENEFVRLGVQNFQPAVFTGSKWNEVPANLANAGKKPHKKKNPGDNNNQNPNPGDGGNASTPPGNGNPNPYPTYSCDPSVVTCNPNAPNGNGITQPVTVPTAGGILAGLPVTWLRARRRRRRRSSGAVR